MVFWALDRASLLCHFTKGGWPARGLVLLACRMQALPKGAAAWSRPAIEELMRLGENMSGMLAAAP